LLLVELRGGYFFAAPCRYNKLFCHNAPKLQTYIEVSEVLQQSKPSGNHLTTCTEIHFYKTFSSSVQAHSSKI